MYFAIACPIPQSRNRLIVVDGISAIAYNPYSAGDMILPKTIDPTASIRVDAAFPMKS